MKQLITALITISMTLHAIGQNVQRTCYEINGPKTIKTNLECYDLDKMTPGTYWYDKERAEKGMKNGEIFAPELTIEMRKMAEQQRVKTAPKTPNIDQAQ